MDEATSYSELDHELSELIESSKVEASVWRLGPLGKLINSSREYEAQIMADKQPDIIYFFAELGGFTE